MPASRSILVFLSGLVAGAAILGAARFVAMPPADDVVHYHANWAVMLDGERLDLSSDRYMEDVAGCRADPSRVMPRDRVHMHGNDHDAVHVHAAGATWGHLLANLGFGIGDDYLVTDEGVRHESGSAGTLEFILNGQRVPSIRNRLIQSRDRLLISYGPEPVDEVIRTQFPRVASTAERLNSLPDPATCSGPAGETTRDRLRRAFWF
ncbi:MAG TPA: hypothetical protein VGE02_01280 [Gemmatimonadales bacterium]